MSGCSGVSVCLTPTWAYTHTCQLLHTFMCSGLRLMDGGVKHTPLDLGRDDCKCGTSHRLSGRIHRIHLLRLLMHVGAAVCVALT